ncbi:MAG: site-2 protease family protein, partial [bacterium]|nr:site-2 protease family protein [bacterium]
MNFTLLAEATLLLGQSNYLSQLSENLWLGFQVALGLGFVIFVHELGHFLAAKTFGVRCDKFYIGFDVPLSIGPIRLPRTLGKFQWGETEYGIGIIPLGGYVKMLGQDDDPRKAEEEAAKTRLGEGEDAPLDPRSYPAKPVWQRMIIISAGVVMNLIFAVILAGAAYWIGASYTPTVVGSTYAGGPAWQAGLQPGDQILSIGESLSDSEKLRYDDFATEVISHGFEFKDQPLKVSLRRDGERIETTINPTPRYHPEGFYFVGLSPPRTPKIANPPFSQDSYISNANPDLKAGDVIVAVDQNELPISERYGVRMGDALIAQFQAAWNRPVTLTIERGQSSESGSVETVNVEVPAVPVKTLGLAFQVGPITAIRQGSAAAESDLRVGDVITKLNGQPVLDALALPQQVAELAGEAVVLELQRAGSGPDDSTTLEVSLKSKPQASFDPIAPYAGELSLSGVGIAYAVKPIIASVDAAAEEAGLRAGDELMQVQWLVDKDRQKELSTQFREDSFKPLVIDDSFTTACLFDLFQGMPVDERIACVVRRDGKIQEAIELTLKYAENWYWHQRGIAIEALEDTYSADSFAEAAQLGLWETSRRFTGVLNFLKLLVTGRVSVNALGGPGRIAYVAASEASHGPSRLMLFLTMLSANLAILNFLPIPALDGGHMVFLTAEAIRGKPVSEDLQVRLTMLGVLG